MYTLCDRKINTPKILPTWGPTIIPTLAPEVPKMYEWCLLCGCTKHVTYVKVFGAPRVGTSEVFRGSGGLEPRVPVSRFRTSKHGSFYKLGGLCCACP